MSDVTSEVESSDGRPSLLGRLVRMLVVAVLLGGVGVGLYMGLKRLGWLEPKASTPPPPPPPLEVFGVEFSDFDYLYNASLQIDPSTGVLSFQGTPLRAGRLAEKMPEGFALATRSQVAAEAQRGMQHCLWGVAVDDDTGALCGVVPLQYPPPPDAAGPLCGPVSPSATPHPGAQSVVAFPLSVRLPQVMWVYGVKPAQGQVFYLKSDNTDLRGRKVYPWYTPRPGEKGSSVVWSVAHSPTYLPGS